MDDNTSKSEAERQERMKDVRMRRTKKAVIWFLVLAVVAGGIYSLTRMSKKAAQNRPGTEFEIQGTEHIEIGAEHPAYNSNPPTSGWHYAQPANWGFYAEELPDEQLIHNLEHGGIWISYKDVDAKTKSDLEAIGKRYPGSVVITPRSANDAKIVLASWGRLEKLESFDETRIAEFIKANKNKSPEPLAK